MASPIKLNVGHVATFSILYLDANGNPMLTTPAPDAAPGWAQSTPASGKLTPSLDGMSATETALQPGSDLVTLTLAVGGVAFGATVSVEVDAEPQVLTSVDIVSSIT